MALRVYSASGSEGGGVVTEPGSSTPGTGDGTGTGGTGATSGPQSYRHTQSTPATTWVFTHNLDFEPAALRIVDTAGNEWDVVEEVSGKTITLRFPQPVAGTVTVS
jgi:hypothetical protein